MPPCPAGNHKAMDFAVNRDGLAYVARGTCTDCGAVYEGIILPVPAPESVALVDGVRA